MAEDSTPAPNGSTGSPGFRIDQPLPPSLADRQTALPRGKFTLAVFVLGFWVASGWLFSIVARDSWLPQAAWFDVLIATGTAALVLVSILLFIRPSTRLGSFLALLAVTWVAVPMVAYYVVTGLDPAFSPVSRTGRAPAMPTPASVPAPIPLEIVSMSREGVRLFGPKDGSLAHKGRMYMDVEGAGSLTLADFVVEARFLHPQSCSSFPWDIGFVFRRDSVHEYAIYVDCILGWRLALLDKDMGSWLPIDRGTLRNLDTSEGGSNFMRLIAAGDRGYVMVNDVHAGTLDLSDFSGKGQIDVAVNFSHSNQRPGKATRYQGFSVWSMPEAAAAVTRQPRPDEASGFEAAPGGGFAAGGRIAFTRGLPGGASRFFSINPDGTGLTAVPELDPKAEAVSWTQDGTRVAWVSSGPDGSTIYTMNADGTNKRQVTSQKGFKSEPSWSRDGRKIAYSGLPPSPMSHNSDIWVVNEDGTRESRLTNDPAQDGFPAWSPDSRGILFQSDRGGSTDIYLMDASGGNQKRITTDIAADLAPAWSPDGASLAFASDRSGRYHIYTMRLDGSALNRLTESSRGGVYPAWSPDGKMIAYSGLVSGGDPQGLGYSIFVIDSTGGAPHRVTSGRSMDLQASWLR